MNQSEFFSNYLSFAQGTGKAIQGMIGFGFTSHLINKHEIFSLPLSPAISKLLLTVI